MHGETHDEPTDGIKSVDTTVRILELLKESDGAGVTEIANELELSKSSVHSHLVTLERNRFVVKEGTTYFLGLRLLGLGGRARKRHRLLEIVKPEVDDLVAETGETAQMLVEEHGRGIYIYQARGDHAVRTDSYIGTEVYLHCTAVGKALLAHLPDRRVEEIIDRHGLVQRTERTVSSVDELYDQLEEIRARGYAIDDGERIEGIRCVGVPIKTEQGQIIGGLSLSGPTKRMQGERFTVEIPDLLTRAARIIEINATYA